ncbi:hypothetical protein MP228_005304 [Amoeboaphelidium protococcarum]|nr:hypothetical protein MP228_005304 [Amoeboaphelidium protococcarum]
MELEYAELEYAEDITETVDIPGISRYLDRNMKKELKIQMDQELAFDDDDSDLEDSQDSGTYEGDYFEDTEDNDDDDDSGMDGDVIDDEALADYMQNVLNGSDADFIPLDANMVLNTSDKQNNERRKMDIVLTEVERYLLDDNQSLFIVQAESLTKHIRSKLINLVMDLKEISICSKYDGALHLLKSELFSPDVGHINKLCMQMKGEQNTSAQKQRRQRDVYHLDYDSFDDDANYEKALRLSKKAMRKVGRKLGGHQKSKSNQQIQQQQRRKSKGAQQQKGVRQQKSGKRQSVSNGSRPSGRKSKDDGDVIKTQHGKVVGQNAQPLASTNVGHQLLTKMGWSTGQSLGNEGSNGIKEPIAATMRGRGRGLGN